MDVFLLGFLLGVGDAFYIKPLLDEILTHFIKFMEMYQAKEELENRP